MTVYVAQVGGEDSRVHHIKQSDTKPQIQDTLQDDDGTVIDLTGATVTITAEDSSGTVKIDAQSGTHNDTGGVATYAITASDTDTAGEFTYEWEITFADGSVQTVPTIGTNLLVVHGEIT